MIKIILEALLFKNFNKFFQVHLNNKDFIILLHNIQHNNKFLINSQVILLNNIQINKCISKDNNNRWICNNNNLTKNKWEWIKTWWAKYMLKEKISIIKIKKKRRIKRIKNIKKIILLHLLHLQIDEFFKVYWFFVFYFILIIFFNSYFFFYYFFLILFTFIN